MTISNRKSEIALLHFNKYKTLSNSENSSESFVCFKGNFLLVALLALYVLEFMLISRNGQNREIKQSTVESESIYELFPVCSLCARHHCTL